ncbi:MAG: IreB family regulatory phosphoprotein [Eubacteriales bacterium]|nr:IreB family regulatory phosphoprotein [Eubacteriales bacterium]
MDNNDTLRWGAFENDKAKLVREILDEVYNSLKLKGYDPISQIVGYILSGDPTYITSYDGARSKIVRVERDELLEELVKYYIGNL